MGEACVSHRHIYVNIMFKSWGFFHFIGIAAVLLSQSNLVYK